MQSLTYLIILGVISLGMGASLEAKEMKRRTIRWHAEEDPRPIETHIYKQVDGMDLRMLVVKPDGWQRQQKRPAMVWVHGGGFTGGSPEAFLPSARYSAARGAVGLSIQYRLMKSPGYKDDATLSERENAARRAEKYTAFLEGPSLTDLIEDCAEAIHVLRTHSPEFGIDPNRITVIGDSAGAYLAAALGTMVEGDARANAVICGSSISDLTSGFGREYVKPGDGAKKKLEEDPERMDRAKNRSPLFNISDNGTAFLILAGTNDWLGEEPRRFHEALKAKGVDAEFVNYLGARHAFILYGYSASDEQITQSLLDMDRFLLQRGLLDGPSALAMPEDAVRTPNPPVPLPEGATGLTFDCHGNFWTLVSEIVHVLPAGTQAWIKDELSGIPDGRWRIILADDNGYLWISDNRRVLCMDPRKPEKGWIVVSENPEFPASSGITRLNNAMSGGVIVTFNEKGEDMELGREQEQTWIKTVEETTWQEDWEVVSRMPGGSHDLGGDVLNGKFYMDWSISGEYGYPSKGNFHSKLLEYDPGEMMWKIAADYGLPRGYCAVGVLDGRIWTVSGAVLDPDGNRGNSVLSQIYDPSTREITKGPDLPVALPSALGLSSGGRLYVLGYPKGKDIPLKLFSIGIGETKWTEEPEGPVGQGSSYGTQLDGKLYTVVDHRCMAIFDTKTKAWETTQAPHSPRSPAVGHFEGEIWVLGGRTGQGGRVTYIYNPDLGEWRKGPDLPRDLIWGCAFNIDGDLYVTGGYDYRSFNNRTFRLRNQ